MKAESLIDKTIKELRKKYEVLGEGRNRIVFLKDENWVIKCPLNDDGISDNTYEEKMFLSYGKDKDIIPYAECRVTYVNDIPLLEMERVHPISPEELPEWAAWVDCAQVGKNNKGEIVAYDFA